MIEEADIGTRIQQIRRKKGFTLRVLAGKTNFSPGFLSKIENSKKAPSINTLMKLAKALNVRMADIFGETDPETSVTLVKKNERRELAREGNSFGYCYEALAPHFPNKRMDPYVLKDPPERKRKAIFQHEGQEMLYVLEGKTKFHHGDKEFVLEEGDCLYFNANVPHYGTTIGEKEFKCLLVFYYPEEQAEDLYTTNHFLQKPRRSHRKES
jgi:transcriptional regulator with XRE-family HTH domain